MIAQFTLIPLGIKGDSLSKALAKAMKHVVESGLEYKAGPMGTTVEGEWFEIMNLINHCRKTLLLEFPRVHITITIDDRKDAKDRITGKISSLEKKMGVKLKK
jgi:uncharacterized protein (TIGR00106 family)